MYRFIAVIALDAGVVHGPGYWRLGAFREHGLLRAEPPSLDQRVH